MSDYQDLIREHCRPLAPRPTGVTKRVEKLVDIRAVLFDIYGTMIISASGDVGANIDAAKSSAIHDALAAMGCDVQATADELFAVYVDMIATHHKRAKSNGIEFPEVDIVEVWRETIESLVQSQHINSLVDPDFKRLSIEYEVRVNPTWPMPGLLECLEGLRTRQLALGIISNAQFYTLELFPALTGKSVNDLGFEPGIQYYSYRYHQAKPGVAMYEMAANALAERAITPSQILYVGNDMLNDIRAASIVGMRTALFAGDARSLRLRDDDERVRGIEPDVVLTELADLGDCI